jgi:hypothetical protein
MRSMAILWGLLVAGCSTGAGEPTHAPATTPATVARPSPSGPAHEGAAPGEHDADVVAEIVEARGTGESVPAAVVDVRWTSRATDTIVIGAYRIEWPGGAFDVKPDLFLQAGESVVRKVRIDGRAGDLSRLDATSARVIVVAVRGGSRPPSRGGR